MDTQGKVVVIGASGSIGSHIAHRLKEKGYYVIAAGRDTGRIKQKIGDADEYRNLGNGSTEIEGLIDGTDAVFNFSGAPVFQKWKGNYKSEIYDSRVKLTARISEAILNSNNPPKVFINGTASGIYGYDSFDDREITEEEAPAQDFWGNLVKDWEDAANRSQSEKTRVVNVRTSVALDSEEGALPQLVKVFRRGLGGPIKPGNQWFPWIHIDDEVGLAMFCMENGSIKGGVNASSPNVPRMTEFARTLGEVLHKPSRVNVPKTIIRLMFGEVSELLTNGKKVVPAKAQKSGFEFKFPVLQEALESLTSMK